MALLAASFVLLSASFTLLAVPVSAHDAHDDEAIESIISTYEAFAAAQNQRALERVRVYFADGQEILWVSNGESFWGRDVILERMGSFQKAKVWRVHPDIDGARVTLLADGAALMHLALTLEIGAVDKPNRLGFLVSIVFVEEKDDWRIASLLTTRQRHQRS